MKTLPPATPLRLALLLVSAALLSQCSSFKPRLHTAAAPLHASFGCVRMGMKDVITIFNELSVGTSVMITEDRLCRHLAPEETTGEVQ